MLRRNADRAILLAYEGANSLAAHALGSPGVCEYFVTVNYVLVENHLQVATETDATFPLTPAVELLTIERHVPFKHEEACTDVESFPKATGAGRCELQTAHVLNLVRTPCKKKKLGILMELTKLLNKLSDGDSQQVVSNWIDAKLFIPLKKRDGGVQPISIGEKLPQVVDKL